MQRCYLLPLFVLGACASAIDGDEIGERATALYGGHLNSSVAAVGVLVDRGNSLCSAFLIRERTVLTSASCLAGLSAPMEFWTGASVTAPDERLAVSDFVVHPQLQLTRGLPAADVPEASAVRYDIAVVHLARPSLARPLPIAPPQFDEEGRATVSALGFGIQGSADHGNIIFFGERRSASGSLDDVRDDSFLLQFANSGLCTGDSGGPALSVVDGQPKAIGIAVWFSNNQALHGIPCWKYSASHARYLRLDALQEFIKSAERQMAINEEIVDGAALVHATIERLIPGNIGGRQFSVAAENETLYLATDSSLSFTMRARIGSDVCATRASNQSHLQWCTFSAPRDGTITVEFQSVELDRPTQFLDSLPVLTTRVWSKGRKADGLCTGQDCSGGGCSLPGPSSPPPLALVVGWGLFFLWVRRRSA